MSTAIAIGASTLQLPDPGESYSLALMNQNNTNIANEYNKRDIQVQALVQGTDPGWVVSGVISKTKIGTVTQVILSGRMTRAVSADATSVIKTVLNVVPVGFRPLGTGVDWAANHLNSSGLIIRHVNAFIASDGTLTITNDPGSTYVMNPGEYWTLQASWWN